MASELVAHVFMGPSEISDSSVDAVKREYLQWVQTHAGKVVCQRCGEPQPKPEDGRFCEECGAEGPLLPVDKLGVWAGDAPVCFNIVDDIVAKWEQLYHFEFYDAAWRYCDSTADGLSIMVCAGEIVSGGPPTGPGYIFLEQLWALPPGVRKALEIT